MKFQNLVSQIKTLLERNLFISDSAKDKIDFSDKKRLIYILEILEKMDQIQTSFVKNQLEKNPHFFKDLERGLTHEVLKKMDLKASEFHQKEILLAEKELEKLLLAS